MAEDIDLSIIVPTYNHEDYIRKCIVSLVNQKTTYRYEIIVGDDCSRDKTRQVVNELKKKYPGLIRRLYHSANIGATKNGYSMLRIARGKYLAFCDGDDFWIDDCRIQRDLDFLKKNPNFSGVCSRNNLVDEQGTIINENNIENSNQFWSFKHNVYTITDFEKWQMPGHVSALTIKNFMLCSQHNYKIFYRAHDMVGDRTIVLLSALNGPIYCQSDIVSSYRFRISKEQNFMSTFKNKNMYEKDYLMMKYLEQYSENQFHKKINLSEIKKERLAGSVVRALRTHNMDDVKIVGHIIYYSEHRLLYFYYVVKIIVLKMIDWNILKIDRRIKL